MMRAVYDLLGEVVHPDQPLMAAGLDSRGAMELRAALQDQLGLEVPTTMLYDAQTVSEAVAYLERLLGDAEQPVSKAEPVPAVMPQRVGGQLLKALRYGLLVCRHAYGTPVSLQHLACTTAPLSHCTGHCQRTSCLLCLFAGVVVCFLYCLFSP